MIVVQKKNYVFFQKMESVADNFEFVEGV